MSQPHETLEVSASRWRDAQTFESEFWRSANRRNGLLKLGWKLLRAAREPRRLAQIVRFRDFYCGDDWNYWWLDAFGGYQALPRRLGPGLEVGCGPYSNIRLLSRVVSLARVTCCDPLLPTYLGHRNTWVGAQLRRRAIDAVACMGETLPFRSEHFDLAVCINVLDHVQSAPALLDELHRVQRPGGYLVLGQDLVDASDVAQAEVRDDIGHPIKIDRATLEGWARERYRPALERCLPRERGRNPRAHAGTYLLIGQKR
jgi:SAM-dependent methyltransferase